MTPFAWLAWCLAAIARLWEAAAPPAPPLSLGGGWVLVRDSGTQFVLSPNRRIAFLMTPRPGCRVSLWRRAAGWEQ